MPNVLAKPPRRKKESVGVQVGASVEAVRAARDAVLAILNSPADNDTRRTALEVFGRVCETKNVTVAGNTFNVT